MTETAARLDWLSVRLIDPYKPENAWEDNAHWHANLIFDLFGLELMPDVKPGRQWQHTRLDGKDAGATLFYGSPDLVMTLEISGKGCERLHKAGKLKALVEKAIEQGDVSRLDIAVDMRCDTDPRDFVAARSNKRQKSTQTAISGTGTTCYIGSPKSDRFARVYRYNDPHPRADLLRCEMVFRGKQAAIAVREWLQHGDEEFAARAGNVYGWQHEVWSPKATSA